MGETKVKELEAEVARWRKAYGPLDDMAMELSGILVASGAWDDYELEEGPQDEDYPEACRNIIAGVRILASHFKRQPPQPEIPQ